MTSYEIEYLDSSIQDLQSIYLYIAAESSPEKAIRFIRRIQKSITTLRLFPFRGTALRKKDSNLRRIGFERKVTVLFRIQGDNVSILRILYGGRDLRRALKDLRSPSQSD